MTDSLSGIFWHPLRLDMLRRGVPQPEVELAKAMVCLDLACALGNCSVDRPTLMKLAGTGEKVCKGARGSGTLVVAMLATYLPPPQADLSVPESSRFQQVVKSPMLWAYHNRQL